MRTLLLTIAVCSLACDSKDDGTSERPEPEVAADDEAAAPVADEDAATPEDAAPPDPQGEFDEEGRLLFRIAACAGDAEVPARFAAVVERHCGRLEKLNRRYRERWLEPMMEFLAGIVPDDLPDRVVYPFGGEDLVSALVAFPDAAEITIISLEEAGDPRGVETIDPEALAESLESSREHLKFLMDVAFHRTQALEEMADDPLPQQLVGALWALAVHERELVSLRFFRVEADGSLGYVTDDFDSFEVTYRAPGGPLQTYRHVAANLANRPLADNPGLVTYIEERAPFASLVKAASFLLWSPRFRTIRELLLDNTVWMVSDATAPRPEHARAAGFEQIPYGRFVGPEPAFEEDELDAEPFVELWKEKGRGRVPGRWGYLDAERQRHLLVTRKVEQEK